MANNWDNRIIDHGEEDPSQFKENVLNWRIHSEGQAIATSGSLQEIGWVDEVMVNTRQGEDWPEEERNILTIVDGHLRVELSIREGEETIPVKYVDLSPAEERKILGTYDYITGMAFADTDKHQALMEGLESQNEDFDTLLQSIRDELAGIDDVEEEDDPDLDEADVSDGSLLSMVDITIEEPRHAVAIGETWWLGGRHVLVCADVINGWDAWAKHLIGDALFIPYPGPLVALTTAANERSLVLVQPDPYVAGHILDRYVDLNGEDRIEQQDE